MEVAKDWHTTPVRVVGGSKLLWYVRACAVREYQIKGQHKREKDAEIAREQATRKRK